MFKSQRILAVVPARGGSKGVPLKNIRPVLGIPLIAYTAKTIKALPFIDRAVVSTDHPQIAEAARSAGLDVPFMRPDALSADIVADLGVLVHALEECERSDGVKYNVVVMLQPTSPLRDASDIEECVQKLIHEDLDAVWTVSEVDLKVHPYKQLKIENGRLDYFCSEGKNIIARQQLSKSYIRNGICYAMTRNCLLEKKSIFGDRAGAVVITRPIVNIDTLEDFATLESYLGQH